MTNSNNKDVLDWEDLSPEDQERADQLMQELNQLFKKYTEGDKACDDSTLND